jgi:hypothetical protein
MHKAQLNQVLKCDLSNYNTMLLFNSSRYVGKGYVSPSGSYGCFRLPVDFHQRIIDHIKVNIFFVDKKEKASITHILHPLKRDIVLNPVRLIL